MHLIKSSVQIFMFVSNMYAARVWRAVQKTATTVHHIAPQSTNAHHIAPQNCRVQPQTMERSSDPRRKYSHHSKQETLVQMHRITTNDATTHS